MMSEERPISILLVEDNEVDATLATAVLQRHRVRNEIYRVHSGEEALGFLSRTEEHADKPPVELVLLDLQLPGMDGHDVLKRIRDDPSLSHLQVIVLTTSSEDDDMLASYRNHADAYIVKPFNYDQFIRALGSYGDYGIRIVRSASL